MVMPAPRIAVVGAGAIGGIAASVLARLGQDVTLCVRRPIPRLIVNMDDGVPEAPVAIAIDPACVSPVAWVLLAIKAQDTPGTAPWLDRLVGPATRVVVLQNGIDHVGRVAPLLRQGEVLPAIVYSSGEVIAPGHIHADGVHRYVVPAGPAGAAFAQLFAGGNITVEQTDDFVTAAWRKFLANISVNPITALTMRRIGIMRDPEIRAFARAILVEAVAVGRAAGARIEQDEIGGFLDSFAAHDPDGGSSMLFDRLAGRPMEHEHLSGALVRAAQQFDIDVPVNRAVLALLRGLQESLARSE